MMGIMTTFCLIEFVFGFLRCYSAEVKVPPGPFEGYEASQSWVCKIQGARSCIMKRGVCYQTWRKSESVLPAEARMAAQMP
jgi:hypothetical protein